MMRRTQGLLLDSVLWIRIKFGSGSGKQQVVSKEAIVDETGFDGEKYEEDESQILLGNSVFVDIYYAFVDYRHCSDNKDLVEWIIMQPVRLDFWVAAAMTCLEHRAKLGGHE